MLPSQANGSQNFCQKIRSEEVEERRGGGGKSEKRDEEYGLEGEEALGTGLFVELFFPLAEMCVYVISICSNTLSCS